MKVLPMALGVLVVLPLVLLAAGQLGALQGQPPTDLGLHDGRLKAPSDNPNSVSSQADLWPQHPQQAYARIAPLAAPDGAAALGRLKTLIEATPGATVVEARSDYVYARFSTRWLKFVDDAEFWFDPAANAIQVRSASRLGRKDFGVNRARVEALRAGLAAK